MSSPSAADLQPLAGSTQSLLRTIADLTDDQVAEPSLLPGWTRGHVLTHIARNADAFGNLVRWAQTGVETPMYVSREHRTADIEAGAGRSAAELIADVESSSRRLQAALESMTADQWSAVVRYGKDNRERTASEMPHLRRVEVEIHHVDLDLDYTLAHLPEDLVLQMIGEVATQLSGTDAPGFVLVSNENEGRWVVGAGGQEITGTPSSLLGWLIGRTDGIGVSGGGGLPQLPRWR